MIVESLLVLLVFRDDFVFQIQIQTATWEYKTDVNIINERLIAVPLEIDQ